VPRQAADILNPAAGCGLFIQYLTTAIVSGPFRRCRLPLGVDTKASPKSWTMARDYSTEPEDHDAFTRRFDVFYSRFAGVYDVLVKALPVWKDWLRQALPHIVGPRVLEVSFGTGYLLSQYAARYEVCGIDLNQRMVRTASANLDNAGAALCQGSVTALPYRDASFDTVVNTMAFSGYPDARAALGEMTRVLKPDGRLVMIDVNYPNEVSWPGDLLVECWKKGGDLIRDMDVLFESAGLAYQDEEIGGFGSVHLYIATRKAH